MQGYEIDKIPKGIEDAEVASKETKYSLAATGIDTIIKERVDSFSIEKEVANNNFNIFQALDLFSKEGFLSKEDRKSLDGFERDLNLEAKLLDNSLSYDDLTPEELLKMSDYFKLITKLTPKLESANPDKINNLIKKYSEDNGKSKPFKKKRFRDVKRQLK